MPARLSSEAKQALVDLVDEAVAAGWPHTRACAVLGVSDVRVHRWRARRRDRAGLADRPPGGNPVHRLLDWEEQAILDLVEDWAPTDHSHRKLAHRGSYLGKVFVSESTFLRVCEKHRIRLPGDPPRHAGGPRKPLPQIPWERNRIWIWDATHFTACRRVAYAIIDVVTRYWIGLLVTTEMTSTQVEVLFRAALADQHLLDPATGRRYLPDGTPIGPGDDHGADPVLVAWSDNGAEMRSDDTRTFMALMAIAEHHGRPHTPTDQAHVESFFSHLKADWPHLETIRDPGVLDAELARVRTEYNTVRLHAAIGYVPPADEHAGRGPAIRRARTAGLNQARQDRINYNRTHSPESRP